MLCVMLANPALKLQLLGLVHDFCLRNHETFVTHFIYNIKSSLSVSLLSLFICYEYKYSQNNSFGNGELYHALLNLDFCIAFNNFQVYGILSCWVLEFQLFCM